MKQLFILIFCFASLHSFSQTAEDYVKKGYDKYNKKDYKGALIDFNNAIKLSPNDGNLYTGRGMIKKHLHDFKGALADYNKAIAINPNDADAYSNRGILKIALNDANGPCLDFKKAEQLGRKGAPELVKKYCN